MWPSATSGLAQGKLRYDHTMGPYRETSRADS